MITMQDIFVFERTGIDESGKVRGTVPRDRDPAQVCRSPGDRGLPPASGTVRVAGWRFSRRHLADSMPSALIAVIVFVVVAGSRFSSARCSTSARRAPACCANARRRPEGGGTRAQRRTGAAARRDAERDSRRSTTCCGAPNAFPTSRLLLSQADLKMRAGNFLLLCLVIGVVLGLSFLLSGRHPLFGWVGLVWELSALLLCFLPAEPSASRI